jgi:ribosomal protein S27AE
MAFGAVFLLAVGVEMSTEGLSLILGRLRSGIGALVNDAPLHVSEARFAMGLALLLLGLALWVLLIWSAGHRRDVATVGVTCPQCGNPTRRVKRKEWQRILSLVMGEHLTRRHCDTCGWSGLSAKH